MTAQIATNVQLVTDAYDAFSRGDVQAVAELMHPDIEWHEAEHSLWHEPDGFRGWNEVVANVFGRIPQHFDEFTVVPYTYHDAGDTVVVQGRYRGTATAGESLDAEACHVWTVREGRVVGFQQYTDTWQFAEVAGSTIRGRR